jgi:ATP-dependent protease ClpP protease subunit
LNNYKLWGIIINLRWLSSTLGEKKMILDWKQYRGIALSLVDDGYIPVFGDFCNELEEVVVECILAAQKKGKKEISLLINSNGGDDSCFNGIKTAMMLTDIEFTGLVMSRARSNGFRILQHCHKRKAISNANLLWHWGTVGLNNGEIAAIMDGQSWPMERIKVLRDTSLQEIFNRTGVSIEKLMEYALYERDFMASEALELNFIDEILEDVPSKIKKKSSEINGDE